MSLKFVAMSETNAHHLRTGGGDAYGNPAEHAVSDGVGVPCRACLGQIAKDERYLIAAYRPFETRQPYAETGPVFLHAASCSAALDTELPDMLASPAYLVRGYGADERIVYGTGGVIPTQDIRARADALLDDPRVAFVDVRSASNNCYQCRITR